MKFTRCPKCHCQISFDDLIDDELNKNILSTFAKLNLNTSASLMAYLNLFRAPTRDLSLKKMYQLLEDLKSIDTLENLETSMRLVVDAMHIKQDEGTFKQLTNHNYLKKVFDQNEKGNGAYVAKTTNSTAFIQIKGKNSKTLNALQALEDFKNG